MMKIWSCTLSRSSVVYKASRASYQNDTSNMLKAINFSSINHTPNKDIHSNKVDAPFVAPEHNVTRRISVENPNDESYHRSNNNDDNNRGHSMTEEATGYVADKAKRGSRGVVETAFNVGMNLAEGMEQTFGAIKDTTRKVKETVLGEHDNEGGANDHDRRGKADKHVEDLRRKAGGYDKRSH